MTFISTLKFIKKSNLKSEKRNVNDNFYVDKM